ncbi:Predicted hydrolase of the alpha/beta-hydrolase fold [Streptomyces sp. Ncost-T6T-1]|uniref:alpha/beta hydrolase family protein n=1 Tax=Streptomyces sp. Ncost-T6T-1 TaxID=1100828 RepID=UPI0008055051|nr:alpha/beta hydrolase [Streptomyces sp. Ncost-T6T-1]SBU99657.1 Predicted hydrolase of the alpha/beta-hydrolase fold [Streptomyces sp. Ncost-T6T-1]
MASALSRRGALTGLAAGAAALATGTAAAHAAPSTARTPGVSGAPAEPAEPAAFTPPTDTDPAADPAPGAMTLFDDPGFNFAGLLALGAAGMRASDVGEVLTAVNTINTAGLDEQTFTDTFLALGDRLAAPPRQGRTTRGGGGGREAHEQTRRFRSLRASQYYAQALFYVLGTDAPGREEAVYRAGRRGWDTFAGLCDPAAVTDRVPYGRKTSMPVWFFRPDTSKRRRPTVILTNGSDGQNVDMWTYGVGAALERGWNALVYDGPGQGELLFVQGVPFNGTWERAVSPLVDWLLRRPDVDPRRIALTGISMAGNLTVRAAAFEHRLAALVTEPGVLSPWLGFPAEIREIVSDDKEETNRIWNEEVVPELTPSEAYLLKKRIECFSPEAMREAREGRMFTDFWTPAQAVMSLDVTSVVRKVAAPTLVLDYEAEQFYPGQPRELYDLLRTRKEYVKLTAATGAQLHCSPMAPQQHNEVVFDWLEDTLGTA